MAERINVQYKDRLFRLLFGSEALKDNILSLYNALNCTDYNNPSASLRHKEACAPRTYPFNNPYFFFSSVFVPTSFTTVLCAAPAITCPICICIITL